MTPSKFKNRCPVCHRPSWRLRRHLDDVHSVRNALERRILLAFARGRVSVRGMKCPVGGCSYGGSRVAQHLQDAHRDLGAKEKKRLLRKLQWRKTLRQVRELRASGPDPPLATRLDLEGSRGSEAAAAAASAASAAPPPASPLPSQGPSASPARTTSADSPQRPEPEPEELEEPCLVPGRPSASPPRSTSADSTQRPEPCLLPGGGDDVPSADSAATTGVPEIEDEEPQAPSSSTVGRLSTFPAVIRRYLEEYGRHLAGAVRSRKHAENVKSKMGRIVAFLSYMSRDKTELGSWRFLDDAGRIMAWPAELTERERKAVTTVKVYLVNTTQFHVYFMETPPRSSRLSKRQLVSVMRALRSATCQIGTKVVLRQIKVKSEKLQRSVTPEILRRCIAKCRGWIPKLLLSSSQKKHDVGLRHLLYGFFALYLISLYGHRAGVMTNLTTEEVLEAARGADSSSPGVVLNVKNHKTARVFGCAQVFLTHEELGWIQRWMEIRARLRPQCDLVFFNTNHQHVNTITAFARNAWAAMLLPGRPSLTDIRTAVATMCRNTHSSDVRTQMSRVMCHDTRTADRFYAMQLDVGQMAEMRRRFAQCMGDEAAESSQ
ncbi:uncharacterized protein LOC116710907 [Xiphophorus hellerii]|uniref:uncharacterized protein LOC116710907 n=1 Tax=Xiphophorus hellerii TaxID=8084 RepID=UPI0013B35E02|nr:uncharacterized protein LOC116710907 [Xiphophorus hellerii]